MQRCDVWSGSGLGATSCTGLTCTSASFLRHCSLFLIIDCIELSFSVTMKICDWRDRAGKSRWVGASCAAAVCRPRQPYLQLWGENGFELQAQDVLGAFQSRRRPLLVRTQALQRLLSALSGLEPVHHLTRQEVGALVTPAQGLNTRYKQNVLNLRC